MSIVRRAIGPLRVLLVVFFALLVVFQFLPMPGQLAHMASEEPDFASLRWPLTALAALGILCIQVVVVCTWRLLGMVQREQIFTSDAIRWVDVMIGAIAVGWLVFAGAAFYAITQADDPGGPMVLLLVVLSAAVAELLLIVMRGLLADATVLRTEMEAVI